MSFLEVWGGFNESFQSLRRVNTPLPSPLNIYVDKISADCFKWNQITKNMYHLNMKYLKEKRYLPNHLFIIANELFYLNVKTNYLSYVLCTSVDGIIWKPEH